jgi:hypothetical protein
MFSVIQIDTEWHQETHTELTEVPILIRLWIGPVPPVKAGEILGVVVEHPRSSSHAWRNRGVWTGQASQAARAHDGRTKSNHFKKCQNPCYPQSAPEIWENYFGGAVHRLASLES